MTGAATRFLDTFREAPVNSRRVMIGRRRFCATLLMAYCGDRVCGWIVSDANARDLDVGVDTVQRPAAPRAESALLGTVPRKGKVH